MLIYCNLDVKDRWRESHQGKVCTSRSQTLRLCTKNTLVTMFRAPLCPLLSTSVSGWLHSWPSEMVIFTFSVACQLYACRWESHLLQIGAGERCVPTCVWTLTPWHGVNRATRQLKQSETRWTRAWTSRTRRPKYPIRMNRLRWLRYVVASYVDRSSLNVSTTYPTTSMTLLHVRNCRNLHIIGRPRQPHLCAGTRNLRSYYF